jgi:hydroxyethylthiazole kinase-like uncharacterized protein yjeF
MEPITFEEVAVLDANSEYRGVPTLTLMENAGRGVAEHLLATGAKGKRVVILCGTGNNGGDGFVAARYLAPSSKVEVVLVRPRSQIHTVISRHNLQRVEGSNVPVHDSTEGWAEHIDRADIIVDGLLGVGIEGPPRGPYAEAISAVNASRKRVVSIDVPSGWGTKMAVRPESTVTFHAPKVGMGSECGRIVVKPIGIPEQAMIYAGPGDLLLIPKVARDAHKGQRGTVLVVGGGPYHGAPTLASLAAHRSGVDLVFVAVPGAIADVVRGLSPDLIVTPLGGRDSEHLEPAHWEAVKALSGRADAVVLGPGMGTDTAAMALAVEAFGAWAVEGKPVIVDADALRALARAGSIPTNPKAVLTPHAGEFSALAGEPLPHNLEGRLDAVHALARRLGCTVLAKGPVDIVSDGWRMKLNDSGNSAMATGGTGDVLSGVVGAFLAKGMHTLDAARAAAFAVGAAGDVALATVGHSMLATDVLAALPGILARHVPWWTAR